MECEPASSALVEISAIPSLFSVPMPSCDPASRKATKPEGGAPLPLSFAVKVTDVPQGAAKADDVRLTIGVACITTCT
jgi:hypothetical protein